MTLRRRLFTTTAAARYRSRCWDVVCTAFRYLHTAASSPPEQQLAGQPAQGSSSQLASACSRTGVFNQSS